MRGANLASRFSTTHHAGLRTGQMRSQEPYALVHRILNVGDPEFDESRTKLCFSAFYAGARRDELRRDTSALTLLWQRKRRARAHDRHPTPHHHDDTLRARGLRLRHQSLRREAHVITPETPLRNRAQPIAWSHPAYAQRSGFARNDTQVGASHSPRHRNPRNQPLVGWLPRGRVRF